FRSPPNSDVGDLRQAKMPSSPFSPCGRRWLGALAPRRMRGLQGATLPDRATLRRGLCAAVGLSGVLFALGTPWTPQRDAVETTGSTDSATEVQRFCSNIVDAARDRRYAMQAEELEKLKSEIDERIRALEARRLEFEQWVKRRDDFLAKAQDNVVKIYAK